MSRLRTALIAASLALCAGAVPAQAGFVPGNELVTTASIFGVSGVGMDAQGNSVVVWADRASPADIKEVKLRRVSVSGVLGPIVDLAPGEIGFQPRIAVTAGGRAFAAWRSEAEKGGPDGVKGRWIEPDGTLGPLLTLVAGVSGTVDVEQLLVAVDPAGVASVAWAGFASGNELDLRRVQPNSIMSPILVNVSEGGVTGAVIAALPNGSTVLAWRSGGIERSVVEADLDVKPVETISGPGLHSSPNLAVDANGNGLVAWRTTFTGPPNEYAVQGRRLDPAGDPFGGEVVIDPPAAGFVGVAARISADTAGDFVVSWSRQNPEGVELVFARQIGAVAGFHSPSRQFSFPPGDADGQRAALMDDGSGALVWRSDGLSDSNQSRLFGPPALTPDIGFQQLLGDDAEIRVASAPSRGVAAFLMLAPAGPAETEIVLRRFMVPPRCTDSVATVPDGRTISIPISCTGLLIQGGRLFSGPAHGSVGFDPATASFHYTPRGGYEGPDSFTYFGTNEGGDSNLARVNLAVSAAKVTPRPPSPPFTINQFRVLRQKKKTRRGGRTTIFRFRLGFSAEATARVVVQKRLPGVRRGKRCVKRRPGRTGKRCPRWRKIGTLRSRDFAPATTLRPPGKLQRKLRRGGRFKLLAVATDRAGNSSPRSTRTFRAAKRPKGKQAKRGGKRR